MTAGAEQHLRTTTEYLDGDDADRLAAVLDAFRLMRQPLGSIEPEPDQVQRRRFRRDRIVPTGYRVDLSVGVGDRPGEGSVPAELFFLVPEDRPGFTGAQVRAALAEVWPAGVDWELSDEFGPVAVLVSVPDLTAHESATVARFVLGAMRAFGATTPTGRWRCTWTRHRTDPEVPAASA